MNESATPPSASGSGWATVAQTAYTFTTAGTKTLYAWARDAAGWHITAYRVEYP